MKVVFITQSYDVTDAGRATAVRWAAAFEHEEKVSSVRVLTLFKGSLPPPDHGVSGGVEVFRRSLKIATLVEFLKKSLTAVNDGYMIFLVHQDGPYPLFLAMLRVFWPIKIIQWKAHPSYKWNTFLAVRFLNNATFTCNDSSLTIPSQRRYSVGHGVDTELFAPQKHIEKRYIVTTGRVAPSKKIDKMIRVLGWLRQTTGIALPLLVVGPVRKGDYYYFDALKKLASQEGVGDLVKFCGGVVQSELPRILGEARIYLNFSETALDKGVLEAMSCQTLVLSINSNVGEILPSDLRGLFYLLKNSSIQALSSRLNELLSISNSESSELEIKLERMRGIVLANHNVSTLPRRIIETAERHGLVRV